MKPNKFLFILLTFIIYNLTFNIAYGIVRFVSKTGSSTPPYTSWETAADSIQKCINISQFGDTIYVANGVYYEQVIMIPGLALIGAGMDSCVIDTRELVTSIGFISVKLADSCVLEGFHIIVYNNNDMGYGISVGGNNSSLVMLNKVTNSGFGVYSGYTGSEVVINKNVISNVVRGLEIFNSSPIVKNNIISTSINSAATIIAGVYIGAFNNNYSPIIDSNYIETDMYGIYKSFGSRPTIAFNTIIMKPAQSGIILSISDSANVHNNLIISKSGGEGIDNAGVQFLQLYNNYIKQIGTGIITGPDIVKNNVVTNANTGVRSQSTGTIFQYNNLWNNGINYNGITPDSTNISVDPMIVNDDTTQGELDFHLQKYSPLIDAGDPNILDRDGSRSDIGLYGGPYGWTYTYNDLAPRPPHNITAVIEDGLIKLTWNKNTEADFSFYRIYRDTVSILIYDSTKIVEETSDTLFYDNLPITNTAKKYYYLITAFDNQGNQSAPGEEVNVTVTGMTEHPPIGDDGYRLLSNYPNPFNPSTIIPYRLKDAGYVKLYIYDVKGELIKTLVNQWQERGYYEIVFHPNTEERQRANSYEIPVGKTYSDIATGVYIYQIMVKSENNIPVFSDTGKMILLK